MTDPIEHHPSIAEPAELQRVADLLGGERVFRRPLRSSVDAHEMLLQGLPERALTHLMDNLVVLRPAASIEKAVGMSLRVPAPQGCAGEAAQRGAERAYLEVRRGPGAGDFRIRVAGRGRAMAGA